MGAVQPDVSAGVSVSAERHMPAAGGHPLDHGGGVVVKTATTPLLAVSRIWRVPVDLALVHRVTVMPPYACAPIVVIVMVYDVGDADGDGELDSEVDGDGIGDDDHDGE